MRKVYTRLDQIVAPRPNWATTVKEAFEYKTEIFMSEDGHEERHGYRVMPRWSVQYRADGVDDVAALFFSDLVRPWTDREFVVPVRWRAFWLTSDLADASSSFTVTGTAPWWLEAGVSLVLEDSDTQDAVTVLSVTPGTGDFAVSLTGPTGAAFSAGTRIMLGLPTHYEQENTLTSAVRRHRSFQPTFLAIPGEVPILEPPTTGYPTYRGYQVVPGKHNWADDLPVSLDDRREVVDIGRGIMDFTWARTHRIISEARSHVAMNTQQAAELVQLFMRHRGMRVPFWTPLAGYDVPANTLAVEGGQVIHFPGAAFRATFEDDPVLNHFWVQWDDGAVQINRITGYTTSSGTDVAQMEDDWERDVDETATVRWAAMARFGTDRLEIDWQNASVAEAQLPIRALRTDWVPDNDTTDNLKWP